jgi:hypothetical protein
MNSAAVILGIEAQRPGGEPPVTPTRERRTPSALAFTLLGGFSVTRGDSQTEDATWARRVAQTVIQVADRIYRLRLRPGDSVDADLFEASTRSALAAQGVARLPWLERAASLWAGGPLPEERYSDGAIGWRERLSDLHVAVLAALADSHLECGDLASAGLRARDLVVLEPLNEGVDVLDARASRTSRPAGCSPSPS